VLVGEPEVVTGRHRACCTIARLAAPGEDQLRARGGGGGMERGAGGRRRGSFGQ
jgi:hypothetical protein